MNRRDFIFKSLLATAGSATILNFSACNTTSSEETVMAGSGLKKLSGRDKKRLSKIDDQNWKTIRDQFALTDDYIHMSAMLFATHPKPVREAISGYRENLDQDPVMYMQRENRDRQQASREAAARYLNVDPDDIALTDSTTMGLAIVYQGLRLNKGDEIILASDDYYSTYASVHKATQRTGAKMVEVDLYENAHEAEKTALVSKVQKAVTLSTRVVALTWVHSGTGLKMPVKQISELITDINSNRNEEEQILLIVDGVHGFGVEDFEIQDLGCDIFIAGCHKWLFGPRGTGIVWANDMAWKRLSPVIPSFIDSRVWEAWRTRDPIDTTNGSLFTPGGFKSFEHLWALPEAFDFHLDIGKKAIAGHTHRLTKVAKEQLMQMSHITVATPKDQELSSGIISFDIRRIGPWDAVARLQKKGIIASVNPYSSRHVRITPSLYNSMEEVEYVLEAIQELG
jgi:isopenicillin-N epimerase